MTNASGLRKRRTHLFVQVPSTTIRDKSLSFRARGLLAYLLDMPDGWDVRSEMLAREGKEGRDAIRSALRELAEHGYYRLERRQTRGGTWAMGTAISETPVKAWAAQHTEFGGGAVPCVQQADDSYKVVRADGTLADDDFPEAPVDGMAAPEDAGEPQLPTGDGFSGPGEGGAGKPAPGKPASGEPGPGLSGPLGETERVDTEEELRSDSLRSPAADTTPEPDKIVLTDAERATGRTPDGKPLVGKRATILAQELTRAWWDWIDSTGHSKPAQSFPACMNVIAQAIRNGISPKDLKRALSVVTEEGQPVSGGSLQIILRDLGGQAANKPAYVPPGLKPCDDKDPHIKHVWDLDSRNRVFCHGVDET